MNFCRDVLHKLKEQSWVVAGVVVGVLEYRY